MAVCIGWGLDWIKVVGLMEKGSREQSERRGDDIPIIQRRHKCNGITGCDGCVGDETRGYRSLASGVGEVAELENPFSGCGGWRCR